MTTVNKRKAGLVIPRGVLGMASVCGSGGGRYALDGVSISFDGETIKASATDGRIALVHQWKDEDADGVVLAIGPKVPADRLKAIDEEPSVRGDVLLDVREESAVLQREHVNGGVVSIRTELIEGKFPDCLREIASQSEGEHFDVLVNVALLRKLLRAVQKVTREDEYGVKRVLLRVNKNEEKALVITGWNDGGAVKAAIMPCARK